MLTGRTAQDDGDASASASSIFFSSSIVLGAWSLSLGYYDILVLVVVAVGSRPMAHDERQSLGCVVFVGGIHVAVAGQTVISCLKDILEFSQ